MPLAAVACLPRLTRLRCTRPMGMVLLAGAYAAAGRAGGVRVGGDELVFEVRAPPECWVVKREKKRKGHRALSRPPHPNLAPLPSPNNPPRVRHEMRPSSPGDAMETDTPRDEATHVPGLLGRLLSAVGLGGGRRPTGEQAGGPSPSSSDSDTSSRGASPPESEGLPPPSGLAGSAHGGTCVCSRMCV